MADALLKSLLFVHYLTLLYHGDLLLQQLLVYCFGVRVLSVSVLLLCSNQNLPCASLRLAVNVFVCDSSVTPSMTTMCASQTSKKVNT